MKTRIYYVSEDLQTLMEDWCSERELKPPSSAVFDELRADLKRDLQKAFAKPIEGESDGEAFQVEIHYLHRRDLRTLTRDETDDEFWIALDDVCITRAEHHLKISRIYDEDGTKIGVSSATSGESIETQLDFCVSKYNDARKEQVVVLADDGTYTGNSIVEIALQLRKRRITVQRIKLGFCTRDGEDTIYDRLDKEGFPPLEISASRIVDRKKHAYVWVCERDFYLGVPRSGRTYGTSTRTNDARPSKYPIGFPYVEPFAASRRGGDIKHGIAAFSRCQIRNSLRLWSAIESLNSKRFKVGEVPRFPGPGGEKEFEKYRDLDWQEYVRKVAEPMFSDL